MRSPFSLYVKKLKSGPVWYARFYDPATDKYSITRSTGIPCTGKKKRKIEAYKVAEKLSETILDDRSPLFLSYLTSFWKENSQYMRSKRLVEKKPVSHDYIKLNALGIKKHVLPYPHFAKLRLSDLKPGMIEDWKLWALERGTGSRRVNAVMQAMSVPVRYAVSRGDLPNDPFRNIKKVAYTQKEKGILNNEEVGQLINVEYKDSRVKLAVLLAILAGLRRGEVRGLRWGNIDRQSGLICIENNYIDSEGIKPCKCGSNRQVVLPTNLLTTLDDVYSESPYRAPEDFVLFSLRTREEPCSNEVIRRGFFRILEETGISRDEQKVRNLTFHGMRHTFVTLARMAGLPDIVVQSLAGHKSADMMNHYSHAGQVINFEEARQKMEMVANQ